MNVTIGRNKYEHVFNCTDHPLFREALQAALNPFFDDMKIIESDS